MKPIIAITPDVDTDGNTKILKAYIDAIENAGGTPVLVPYTENMDTLMSFIDLCDGVCFTGGIDVDPKRYFEEKMIWCKETRDIRDIFDLSIFELATKKNKPIFAICRGAQLINVALGGTLYQDIPTEISTSILHTQSEPKFEHSHEVKIVENTPLYALLGKERIKANSFHHQAIKKLGKDLEIMAFADDGIVEAIYMPDYPYLRAYQWHPERICQNDEKQKKLFEDFILACKKQGEKHVN